MALRQRSLRLTVARLTQWGDRTWLRQLSPASQARARAYAAVAGGSGKKQSQVPSPWVPLAALGAGAYWWLASGKERKTDGAGGELVIGGDEGIGEGRGAEAVGGTGKEGRSGKGSGAEAEHVGEVVVQEEEREEEREEGREEEREEERETDHSGATTGGSVTVLDSRIISDLLAGGDVPVVAAGEAEVVADVAAVDVAAADVAAAASVVREDRVTVGVVRVASLALRERECDVLERTRLLAHSSTHAPRARF